MSGLSNPPTNQTAEHVTGIEHALSYDASMWPTATSGTRGMMSPEDKVLVNQLGTDSGWIALSYGANWADYGVDYPAGKYKKDANGRVWVQGLVKKTAALAYIDAIATLPTGYRPTTQHLWLAASAAATAATDLRVATDGTINLIAGGSATWISLDCISFDTTV